MPQIPQISGPLTGGKTLTSGNSGSNTPGGAGAEPFSINGVNPVQRPTAVGQKGDASVGANNQGVQGDLNGSMGVPVAKDPSMAVETLHDVFSGDLLENAKLNGYTELVGEIDDLTKAIYINPDKLMNEIMTQEKDNTVFSGDPLFDILRQVSAESGEDTKELVANLLKSLNYAMSRNEIITAIKSNIRFLADYFGQNTGLSKNLNALFEKWDTGNPAENFEMLKNETAALMRTVSGSLQNDSRTEVLVPLVTHNLSRYNTNEYMMKDAFSQLMSQIPSASVREALSKSFGEYVTNLLKANAQGYTPASASPRDVSAEKAAILIYLSNLAGNGEKTNSPLNAAKSGGTLFDSLNAMNQGESRVSFQNSVNAPQINGGEHWFGDQSLLQDLLPIFDSQGKPILDQNGNPVLIPQDQLADNGQGQPIFDSKGQPILNQKGEPVLISQNQFSEGGKGQPIFDSQGQPVLNHKGEPVLVPQNQLAESGNGQPIFDSQGQPILSQRGEPVFIPQNQLAEDGKGQPVFNSKGQPILDQKGEPVLIPQNLLAENGKGEPIFDGQGQPVLNQKGEPVHIASSLLTDNGEAVFKPIFDSQGRPVDIIQPQNDNSGQGQPIFDGRGQPLLDQSGQPVLIFRNQRAEQGQGQQLFDNQGLPVTDQDGKPVFIRSEQLIPLDNRNISGGRISGQRDNAVFGAERKNAADFDSASYHKSVPISENRINYVVNNYKSGVMKGKDAIDQLLALLIPRNASDAAEVMHTAVKGTNNLSDMVNFLNRVLENTPDIPERQILCDAFEEILGIMAKNQEMPTQKFAGYESETMKALTAFIDRNVNHPAIRGIDNFNASNLLQSMLNAPGVFTPLAHYIIPLQVEDTRAFGELWVDNDNSSKGSGGENEPKHFHLFLTFDVEAVGRFEVDAYSKGSDLNLSVLYPKSYRYRVSSLTDKITRIAAGVGYNVQNFKTGILIKPHTLAETFPRIKDNRRSFDVKA